jgi:hypothetical protein
MSLWYVRCKPCTYLDEDIIGSNMIILTTSKLKVQPFYMRLIIDTFDELVLHHKVCIFSFSELLTWMKRRFNCIWKEWMVNEVDWGPSPNIPNVIHQPTMGRKKRERYRDRRSSGHGGP